jgi:hypothetical protein
MIEIIKRREGEKSEKQQINGERVQVSYNSWGHLVIRVIQPVIKDMADDIVIDFREEDTLVVLDKRTSLEVIRFIERINPLCSKELRVECRPPF